MKIDFKKGDGLVPVVIQDALNMKVLMLGYMNEAALTETQSSRRVTFYSRSKKRLWTKGESSGNYLNVQSIAVDCDNDTILIKVFPEGPVCHTGSQTCFNEDSNKGFIYELENVISERIDQNDETSYTNKLFKRGINKVAQKVGEEAVELVIESKDNNDDLFMNEAADLIYHYLILLKAKNIGFDQIERVLKSRSEK